MPHQNRDQNHRNRLLISLALGSLSSLTYVKLDLRSHLDIPLSAFSWLLLFHMNQSRSSTSLRWNCQRGYKRSEGLGSYPLDFLDFFSFLAFFVFFFTNFLSLPAKNSTCNYLGESQTQNPKMMTEGEKNYWWWPADWVSSLRRTQSRIQ